MELKRLVVGFLVATSFGISVAAPLEVKERDGFPIDINLSGAGTLHPSSTLQRRSLTINDASCPVQVDRGTVFISYDSRRTRLELSSNILIEPKDQVTAIEVKYLVYGVFGDHIMTLKGSKVTDLPKETNMSSEYGYLSDSKIAETYMTIAYVSRVRLASGKVWKADEKAIAAEVRKVNDQFKESDLIVKQERDA